MKIRNITADIVFLGPTDTRTKPNEPFSIFKNIKPNPLSLLAKSLEVSYKIALQLPGDTKIEELPQLFHESLENNGLYSKRFCIEIEKVVNSRNQTECLIVYFGDCSSISQWQENEAIYEYISRNETTEWKRDFPLQVITTLVQKVGIRRSFKYLAEIESEFSSEITPFKPASLFDCFINKITSNNIFSKAYITTLLEEESNKPPTMTMTTHNNSSLPNSYNSFSLQSRSLANNNNTSTIIQSAPAHSQALLTLPPVQEKPKGLLSRLLTESKANKDNNNKDQTLSVWPEKKAQKVTSPKYDDTPSGNDLLGGFKDSYEVSDLPISSYSVSSDYLKDFSEDENPTRRTTLVNLNDSREADYDKRKERLWSKAGRSPMGRTSENWRGGRRKERREESEGNGSRKSLGSGMIRGKDKFRSISPKNASEEAENAKKSFLLQCGEEF